MKNKIIKKEPIRIRTKALTNGNLSIYLDIYTEGKRKYEFLKLYLIPETNKESKAKNKATLELANAIKSKRIVEYQNNQHGFSNSNNKGKILLFDYINNIIRLNPDRHSTNVAYGSLMTHLKEYRGADITFKQIDKDYIAGFIKYLKTVKQEHPTAEKALSDNSQIAYLKRLGVILNRALIDDIIAINPLTKIRKEDKPKKQQTKREFLTIEELQRLEETPLHNMTIKRAFLFGCYCGLRHCDIKALKWCNIIEDNGQLIIKTQQKKTGKELIIPLHSKAFSLLPERSGTDSNSLVFNNLPSLGHTNTVLPKWGRMAKISKHITFHVSRHTHATTLITLGADIYTVSKLLGHSNIQVTQIYAKVIDESKREAVNLLDQLNNK